MSEYIFKVTLPTLLSSYKDKIRWATQHANGTKQYVAARGRNRLTIREKLNKNKFTQVNKQKYNRVEMLYINISCNLIMAIQIMFIDCEEWTSF